MGKRCPVNDILENIFLHLGIILLEIQLLLTNCFNFFYISFCLYTGFTPAKETIEHKKLISEITTLYFFKICLKNLSASIIVNILLIQELS